MGLVYGERQRRRVFQMCLDRRRLAIMPVNEFCDELVL